MTDNHVFIKHREGPEWTVICLSETELVSQYTGIQLQKDRDWPNLQEVLVSQDQTKVYGIVCKSVGLSEEI
jgi:hypothetical protein